MNIRNEFQVVVLAAGKGSRMPELTTHKPKCLLPIGGKPMIWYPLHKLQQSGFTDVILIVCDKDKTDIHSALEKTELTIKIDYVTIQSTDGEWGTAQSLCSIADKIKLDLIIVSCDLITNMDFAEVLHVFRKHDATLASLYFPPNIQDNVQIPGPKGKYKPERDLIGVDSQTNRLVFLASTSDFESDVCIPLNLFRKHPGVKMFSNLLDSHFYVMKNWLLKYMHEKDKYTTFKGEFLPHALKQQFKRKSCDQAKIESNVSEIKNVKTEDIFDFHKESALEKKIREANAYNDHIGDLKGAYHDDSVRCYAIITDPGVIGVRVNTLQAYWSINAKIATEWEKLFGDNLPLVQVDPKSKNSIKSTQVDNCFIWDGVTLNEKTSFKNSIIGSNTEVASFSRVINSVIMNNVKIHERVVIENCIICDDVVINSNSKLEGSIIGSKQNLPAESEHSKEVLTDTTILIDN
ncbi:translation initiation factor eIF2B subunit gamma [Atheta coriaria]|uniref:translation initiation factor eIF2B subunit gamma n=1 Tax=Dalotia coriaria TaxID=877792 RepID=UPI0031F3A0FB